MVESSRAELVGFYFQEVLTYIPDIQHGLALAKTGGVDTQVVCELYRLFHNIKGAASQVYLQYLSGVANLAEFLLGQAMTEESELSPDLISFLEKSIEEISEYCSRDQKDDIAEANLLAATLSAFRELCSRQGNIPGIALHDEIRHLLEGDQMNLSDARVQVRDGAFFRSKPDGSEAFQPVLTSIDRLIDASLGHLAAGPEGCGKVLAEMQKTVHDIAACAEDLRMPVEESGLRDLEGLLAQVRVAEPAHCLDSPPVVGYFMSLLCMQTGSMLLRFLEQAGDGCGAMVGNFVALFERLLAPPSFLDQDSAFRITERISRIKSFATNDTSRFSPASEVNDLIDESASLLPDMDVESTEEAFLDDFLADTFADDALPEALPGEMGHDRAITDEEGDAEADILHEIFREECEDHLVVISRSLSSLEGKVPELIAMSSEVYEDLEAMRRAGHTLKGAAAMVGYEQLAACAHSLEELLDWLHDQASHIGPADLRIMASAIDLIENLSRQPNVDNSGRIAELQQTIAGHFLADQAVSPAQDETTRGSQALQPVILHINQLIEAIRGHLVTGHDGGGMILADMQRVVREIADWAENLDLPVEEGALRDFEEVLRKASSAGLATRQDIFQVIGSCLSLLCMQIGSILLRLFEKTEGGGVALLREFVTLFEGLLAPPALIDQASAVRISERIERIKGLTAAEILSLPPSVEGDDLSGETASLLPDMEDETIEETFLDDFLADTFSEAEVSQVMSEVTESNRQDCAIAETEGTDEEDILHEIFREECEDHLVVISRTFNSLEGQIVELVVLSADLRQDLAAMRRAVHTLKGAAAMVGYEQLAACAHSLEDMLDWLYDHATHIDPTDLRIIASAIDLIEHLSRQPNIDNAAQISDLQQAIAGQLATGDAVSTPAAEVFGQMPEQEFEAGDFAGMKSSAIEETGVADYEKAAAQDDDAAVSPFSGNIRVKIENLDEIIRIEGELVVTRSSMEGILNELRLSVEELHAAQGKLRRIAQELESGYEVQSLYGFGPEALPGLENTGRKSGGFTEFDPIELDRYSQLNLIIRSLNELSVDVNSIHSGMAGLASEMSGHIAKQQLIMGAMQDKLMRTRMTPMSAVSRTFFRIVRITAEQLGKNVRLTVTGDDVFMDRFIWSKITDPLMHILRNCVDHGIESADLRREKGKPENASIRIEAKQLGSFVLLRISDDGSGIDMTLLRQKLRVIGLVDKPETLSDEDLLPYLFHSGLSTKDQISQISGRGVGLDVVQKNIQELRGTVRVETKAGQGTLFELRIPITLSINKAILVTVSERQYAIPLQDIVEIRSVPFSEIAGEDAHLSWRQELLPVKDLGVILQLREPLLLQPGMAGNCMMLIVQGGKGYVAVIIDEVMGQREIVVKDLGSYLTHVKGISGVTILGDGSLIPVLNFSQLTDASQSSQTGQERVTPSQSRELPLQVLIVDDSISVRQSIARLVKHQSWRPEMAVDGVDALEKLETFHPDAIILDIEMPRMNGYELMGILRKNEKYRSIPVIMLTSRTSDKHRAKADELGVDFYLTKPFQDEVFVQLLGGSGNTGNPTDDPSKRIRQPKYNEAL